MEDVHAYKKRGNSWKRGRIISEACERMFRYDQSWSHQKIVDIKEQRVDDTSEFILFR